MSSVERRLEIFNRYASNLSMLKAAGHLADLEIKYECTYICPICLEQFSLDDLDTAKKNHLTLEDAPPKSLGGKPGVLTCKQCNNTLGYSVDFHLVQRMRDMDLEKFLPGVKAKVRLKRDDHIVQGTVEVNHKGEILIKNSYQNNNNEKLDQYIENVSNRKGDKKVEIVFLPSKVDPKRLQVAILKSAYLILFERFGYAFLLDPVYNIVRDQLVYPEREIYPMDFWFFGPFSAENIGTPFVTTAGVESIMVIFKLISLENRIFGAIIPVVQNAITDVVSNMHELLHGGGLIEVAFVAFDPTNNYISDIESVENLLSWIDDLKQH